MWRNFFPKRIKASARLSVICQASAWQMKRKRALNVKVAIRFYIIDPTTHVFPDYQVPAGK